MIGKMLGNRYEVQEKLGGGGMSIVYKARDTYLNRLVTIKFLRPEFNSDEDFIRRFRREAQAVASLSHPNIVNIHDVGQEDGVSYLVMEYINGDNLKEIISKNGLLTPADSVRFAVQVCEALEHAHQNNIVHRDVKPHNILVTAEGRAKLTDFGIAMEANAATITRTDTIMGSVHYLSPEQARGEVATARSDIYSVGILLYEMLTGQKPYSGETPIAVALKHIQENPRPLNELNPDVPGELAAVVMRAIEKNPEQRYGSALELSRHLESAVDDGQATVLLPADEIRTQLNSSGEKDEENGTRHSENDRRASRVMTWTALLVLLTGLLAGAVYAFINYMDVDEITVPDVVGKQLEDARVELEARGLGVEVIEEYSEAEEGEVIDQDIGPDDPAVKPPRDIKLTVSMGVELVTVPDLYELTAYDAEIKLRDAGLIADQPGEGFHPEVEKGKIFKQTPVHGEQVSKGYKVKFTLSLGPEPIKRVVPDLTGKTLSQAREILDELNLVLNESDVELDYSSEYQHNQIINQKPSPDTEVEEGTEVKITLNKSAGPVERQATVKIEDEIPNDGLAHIVEIVVIDLEGRNTQYANAHTFGDKINKKITYVGQGVVQVYIDTKQVMEGELK